MTAICETSRLTIRQFELSDQDFVLRLLNDPSFIRNIGDKQVRTSTDAVRYLQEGPIASYHQYGFGLNLVSLKDSAEPIGMCGLLKRDELEHPDLGYAFLPEYCAMGYARESSEAVLNAILPEKAIDTVLAITLPDNQRSIHLLTALGFKLSRTIELYESMNNLYTFTGQHMSRQDFSGQNN